MIDQFNKAEHNDFEELASVTVPEDTPVFFKEKPEIIKQYRATYYTNRHAEDELNAMHVRSDKIKTMKTTPQS